MGQITCDGFYNGMRGESWVINTLPVFHVALEEGDGYIPGDEDFGACIDDQPVPVKLIGANEVYFQPAKALEPGYHHISIIFWPQASYPQARALEFEVCTEPARITSCLGNDEEGFYLLFFDKPLNKDIAESKMNWSIGDFNDVLSDIELINGGLTALVRIKNDSLSSVKAVPKIEFNFNGSRGLSKYSQGNFANRTGERAAQAPPPHCVCDINVYDNEGYHSYEQGEQNACCYRIEAAGAPPCDTALDWGFDVKTPVDNADPWDFPFALVDPYDYDETSTALKGFSLVSLGYHTLEFNRNENHEYFALVAADCIPQNEPGGEGFETLKGCIGCNFTDADITPPDFIEGTPALLNGPDAAKAITDILDAYDNPAFGEAHYIGGGDRSDFEQAFVDPLRDDPCKMVILAFARDNHNLKGNYSPFALEYGIDEEFVPGTVGIAFMARFDKIETAPNEHIPWPDPDKNYQLLNDGQSYNEYELNYWILNEHFGDGLEDLDDIDFLRVRVEDQAVDDSYHGNWRRSEDLLPSAMGPYVMGIKAYQQFVDPSNPNNFRLLGADYFDGPSFARYWDGNAYVANIEFAAAVIWHGTPPESIQVVATNSPLNEPHLPIGCERTCNFYAYRLKEGDVRYQKLCELFGIPAKDCLDFYMRGPGLTYMSEDISPSLLIVSDDDYTNSQEEENQLGDWPVLYMSHRDHLLPEEFQDDYSSALSCHQAVDISNAFQYGNKRGRYDPAGNVLNVFNDLKLGGTGKLELKAGENGAETEVSVQSGGDLFVSVSHGGIDLDNGSGPLTPYIGHFYRRASDGEYSTGCLPITDDATNPAFWDARFRSYEFNNFSATDWWINIACWQLDDGIGWPNYWAELIYSQKLLGIAGYGAKVDIDQSYLGMGRTSISALCAPYFNGIMNETLTPCSDYWAVSRSGDKFIWAWMESHCKLAREFEWPEYMICSGRAIDIGYMYYLKKTPGHSSFMWFKYCDPIWKIYKYSAN